MVTPVGPNPAVRPMRNCCPAHGGTPGLQEAPPASGSLSGPANLLGANGGDMGGMLGQLFSMMLSLMMQWMQQMTGGAGASAPETLPASAAESVGEPGASPGGGGQAATPGSDPGNTGSSAGSPQTASTGGGNGPVIERLSGSPQEMTRQGIQAILAEVDDPEMAKLAIAQFLLEGGTDVGQVSHTIDDNNLFNIKAEGTVGWANSTGDYNGAGVWEPGDRFGANRTANDSVRQCLKLMQWSNYRGVHEARGLEAKLAVLQNAPLPYAEDPNYVKKVAARYHNLMRNNPDIAAMFEQRYGVPA